MTFQNNLNEKSDGRETRIQPSLWKLHQEVVLLGVALVLTLLALFRDSKRRCHRVLCVPHFALNSHARACVRCNELKSCRVASTWGPLS